MVQSGFWMNYLLVVFPAQSTSHGVHHSVHQSLCQTVSPPFTESNGQSTSHWVKRSVHQSLSQTVSPPVTESNGQSTSHWVHHSVHQSLSQTVSPPVTAMSPPVNPPVAESTIDKASIQLQPIIGLCACDWRFRQVSGWITCWWRSPVSETPARQCRWLEPRCQLAWESFLHPATTQWPWCN